MDLIYNNLLLISEAKGMLSIAKQDINILDSLISNTSLNFILSLLKLGENKKVTFLLEVSQKFNTFFKKGKDNKTSYVGVFVFLLQTFH